MSKRDTYKTVAAESETLIIEKKSKFYSHVKPVSDEAGALEYLAEIRGRYRDATHNVYAYIIDENNIFRYSDDGEPSGTAGMPVLDAMRTRNIVDTVIVVTRYFGGTLLGTGGLVRAYGASAKKGLDASGIVTRTMCDIVSARVPYDLAGKVQYYLAQNRYVTEDVVYESDVTYYICSPISLTRRIFAELSDISGGRAELNTVDKKYVNKPDGADTESPRAAEDDAEI